MRHRLDLPAPGDTGRGPRIDPARPVLWRDQSTVQIGLDPATAVVITALPAGSRSLLAALDGSRALGDLRSLAEQATGRADLADELVGHLHEAGALVGPRPSRTDAWVEVRGGGRVGAATAAMLAAEGIGRITVLDPEPTTAGDLSPGGLRQRDLGRPRGRAAEELARAVGAGAATEPDAAAVPDLAVVAPVTGHGRADAAHLVATGVAHLLLRVVDGAAVVGPLVLPGHSSCVRCADLRRTERDADWPRLLVRAETTPPPGEGVPAGPAAVAAALGAAQVTAFLDGRRPCCVDGELVTRSDGVAPRRRSWAPHPGCGCRWVGERAAGERAPVAFGPRRTEAGATMIG